MHLLAGSIRTLGGREVQTNEYVGDQSLHEPHFGMGKRRARE